ncbi:hypothetical protein GF314_00725 [bacterium]|nr:hypothetical protein [bacterium]
MIHAYLAPRPIWPALLLVMTILASAASAATVSADKGIFAQGQLRGGATGGWVSTSGDDYLLLGLGLGYNVADGVTAGLDYETWLVGDPTVHKLAPWVTYTYWQAKRVKPYLGAFYRQNWVGGGFDDYQDLGARAGVFTQRGRAHLGVGVVYEYRLDSSGLYDQDRFYPEIRFAIGL